MLHPSEYHPSVSRFVAMQRKRGAVFVPDVPRKAALDRLVKHYASLPEIRDAFKRAMDVAREAGRLFSYTGIEPPAKPLRAVIAEIKAEVAAKHGVTINDLESQTRNQMICLARFEAMWRCRQETIASLPQIGRSFGNRDHTTVLHGIRRHQARIDAGEA